jgi:hypothetical protein
VNILAFGSPVRTAIKDAVLRPGHLSACEGTTGSKCITGAAGVAGGSIANVQLGMLVGLVSGDKEKYRSSEPKQSSDKVQLVDVLNRIRRILHISSLHIILWKFSAFC